MTATVRLDDTLTQKLENLSKSLHKRKSDVIREAIEYYFKNVEKQKKSKILSAVEKTKHADAKLYNSFEESIYDGL